MRSEVDRLQGPHPARADVQRATLAVESASRAITPDTVHCFAEVARRGMSGSDGGYRRNMRRAAMFRVRSGPRMASLEETEADEETVSKIADELDALADDPTANVDTVERVTNKLRKMGAFPTQLYSAAVQSFLLEAAA
jgi:hypothetical protein